MNREIKFRAWDDKNKIMHDDVSPWRWDFVISNSWHRCEKSTGSGLLGSGGNTAEMLVPAVRYDTLMQFTGLKDKNGKEIYEGDILRSGANMVRSVTFDNGSFVFMGEPLCYDSEENHFDMPPEKWATVIGNIYENPELLK